MKNCSSTATNQVLFLAMGYAPVVKAVNAALTLRKTGNSAHIKLITNFPFAQVRFDEEPVFDSIEIVAEQTESNRWIKTSVFERSEGETNVFLDCDIEVLCSLDPIFALMRNFDVAARNLPFETGSKFFLENGASISEFSMSEVNTGVVFFRRNEGARDLFQKWHKNFVGMSHARDQPAFLKALLEATETRFLALPPMWNATPFKSVDLRQMKEDPKKIRILHYRDPIFWPSVANRLATAHDWARFELKQNSSEFTAQSAAYRKMANLYRSPLFRVAAGRALLRIYLFCSSRGSIRSLRIIGKKKPPIASTKKARDNALKK